MASYILGGTPTTVTSNLEFVPDYIKDEYSITYILEGNLHATIPLNFQAQIIPISMETRTGYTFSGWTPRLPYNMPARDLTVEGEYVKNKRFLHFNTNGGNTIPIRELEYDAPIVLPDTPTKEGFVFQGWDKQDTITRMPDENTWFNAQWT
ncbi:InlB B-repeat-containing protein [bacterium]|nr:InlB B-repeat-containing protein [bacterium]